MIFWLAKSALLSLLLISIIHYLYIFLKNNLTQPKIKDLIHHPKKEYEDIEVLNSVPMYLQILDYNKSWMYFTDRWKNQE